MLEDIKAAKRNAEETAKGTNLWPKAHLEITFDLKQLAQADKDSILEFSRRIFAVVGVNCEMVAVFSGYWDETLATRHLGERAEKLAQLYQE